MNITCKNGAILSYFCNLSSKSNKSNDESIYGDNCNASVTSISDDLNLEIEAACAPGKKMNGCQKIYY